MKKIKCPSCGAEITPSRSAYDNILKQVRDEEFERELESYKQAVDKEKETALIAMQDNADARAKEITASLSERFWREENNRQREIAVLQNRYDQIIAEKDEQIARLSDFRAKQSTKMLGESLEQHCEAEFNKIRAVAFPNAYFEKDNDATEGSKGDFIFRECDESGVEIISIMFEMKNESERTDKKAKKKNEDFFKELDKDRKQKKCEYAVLVSMLEIDNEFYNAGIADVSYKYPKMYVVRPQCFLSIISILRNAALNSMTYKRELAMVKGRTVDMALFEQELEDFKTKFGNNYRLAKERFEKAIKEIDSSIAALEKVKKDLLMSESNLRLADAKAQELTIHKLTKAPKKRKTAKS